MWMYSLIWTVRNVRPSRNVVSIPAFIPKRLPLRTETSAQCSVTDEESRIAVLTPATASGSDRSGRRPRIVRDDADEEVRGEERTEDHHLGDDEKQHPEGRRIRPATNGSRWAGRDGRRARSMRLPWLLPCAPTRRWPRCRCVRRARRPCRSCGARARSGRTAASRTSSPGRSRSRCRRRGSTGACS